MTAQPAVRLSQLPHQGAVRVVLDGVPVAVVRDEDGDVHAINDICTHAEVSLSEGDVEDTSIECYLHGSTFNLRTGEPMCLPATKPVAVYPVTIDGDLVLVDVAVQVNGGASELAKEI